MQLYILRAFFSEQQLSILVQQKVIICASFCSHVNLKINGNLKSHNRGMKELRVTPVPPVADPCGGDMRLTPG